MPARLVALDASPDIPLDGLLTIVGRHQDCDARLDSSRVSRRHCCLAVAGDGVLVRDLGSSNGIRINGLRVSEGFLRDGDELSVAHLRFRLDWRAGDLGPRPGDSRDPGLDRTGREARDEGEGPTDWAGFQAITRPGP